MSAWWREDVIYQIYPRSFADSDGDGLGDLPGATSRLGYLRDLGVDAVWLSPFYTSPQADAGYDVADYRNVDPRFGTLADFDALMARASELGLRVIVDLVPNHCSDEHAWFQAALAAGPGSPERSRFYFRDGQGPDGSLPPNNWMSVFGGPAWTRVVGPDGPEQWYLHLFDSKQPDWDCTYPDVRTEFESVLRFWLDKGVAGFRVDVAHGLVKKAGLPDHPGEQHTLAGVSAEPDDAAEPLPTNHSPYWDQDGVHEIYRSWRAVLDTYSAPQRILCAEAWVTPPERMAHYLRPDEMHQAFAFDFLECHWDAVQLREAITADTAAMAQIGASCTWVLSNHDVVRHASRLGLDQGLPRPHGITADDPQPDHILGLRRARSATMAMLALPGAAYLYQGEELGLPEHSSLPAEVRQDPAFHRTGGVETGRDGCRVPLPWAADAPACGFSPTGASWLPQPEHWAEYAVDAQLGVAGSTLELYRQLLRLRRAHRLGAGSLEWDDSYAVESVLAWRNGDLHVLVNLGAEPVSVPAGHRVAASSAPLTADGRVPLDTAVWSVAD
ncbi:MAG TPA: glycoside hydrolase family 13 protein [Dermatophilaceae bacterium]|nr:glycoside hydrolase family 13 protein [Dermatophilaceae bacterium]